MTDPKIPRKKLMLSFLAVQVGLGLIFLFNTIPFDYILRIFGVFLIVLSPMWLVMFRLERLAKVRDVEKKSDLEEKKKMDEEL